MKFRKSACLLSLNFALARSMALAIIPLIAFLISPSEASAEIIWKRSPQSAIDAAHTSKKPILVYVATRWCHYCEKMKHETWADRYVSDTVSRNFETLALDGDRDQRAVEQLQVNGFPATLLFSPDGRFIAKRDGYLSPSQTIQWLQSERH